MTYPRPLRPLISPSQTLIYRHSYWTMSEKKVEASQHHPNRPKREKRPPLTHFLCLPLVNTISLPQLESSLATFKAAIPSSPHLDHSDPSRKQGLVKHPLIPDGALRPIGTLHLTLGVMSLPTKERLDEAIRFFQSLDLVSMIREAEIAAKRRTKWKKNMSPREAAPEPESMEAVEGDEISGKLTGSDRESDTSSAVLSQYTPEPLTISLESLHALPRARFATVLHAAPVDSTSRLYPFCEMLRSKFLEAGFLQAEYAKPDKRISEGENQSQPQQKDQERDPSPVADTNNTAETDLKDIKVPCAEAEVEERLSLLEELPVDLADEFAQKHSSSRKPITTKTILPSTKSSKSKTRPLLLHATVVNTIYVRGRRGRGGRPSHGNRRRNDQYTFDARDILANYRDYYLDSLRTTLRSTTVAIASHSVERKETDDSNNTPPEAELSESTESPPPEKRRKTSPTNEIASNPKIPFVWAKDFPLETICICEMGAKKLDPDDGEMNARLGEKYTVVTERSLDFAASSQSRVLSEGERGPSRDQDLMDVSSDGSEEGGVRISS